jgi:hypothetical protein
MSSSDKNVDYGVTADPSPFVQAMQRAADSATGSAEKIKSTFDKVEKTFEEVQKKLLLITAVVQGGKFFKEAIGEATKLAGEAINLSRRLGITGEQASALNTALGDIYTDSETYIGAFDKFAKQLRTNESGLRDMGLQTRDANGHLRDSQALFTEALQLVGSYKAGLDQTTAAQELFGKGVDDVMKLQRLNNAVIDDAKKKNEELGLGLTQEGVEATKAYKAAMNDVGDVLTAIKVNIGNAVMPMFVELGNYFASTGPYLVAVFKGALVGLLAAFEAIKATVKTVTGVVFEAINTIIDVGGLLGEVFSRLMRGDFSGAYEAAKGVGQRMAQAVTNAFANFMDSGNEAEAAMARHMQRLYGQGTAVGVPKSGTKQQGAFKEDKEKKDPSQMGQFEEQLAREKVLAAERDALHGMSKEAELQFWKDILATATLSEADKLAVSKKVSAARLELLKQEAQEADQIGALALSAWQERELAKVAAAETEAQLQMQLGRATQSELLAQQADFEQRKAEIRRTAIEANLAALDPNLDVVKVRQLQNELEKMELDHQAKLQQIRGQAALEDHAMWADLQSRNAGLFDKGVNAMMNGTLTWRSASQAVMTEYTAWFAKTVIGDMVKKWLAGKAAQFAATMGFMTAERTAQVAGSAATVAVKATEATAVVSANAAEAASGAAASQASIPYVGWALAGAAFAAVMAMVMGAKSNIKSARGGMDIPAGVNPLTQLHEEEMVLPAHIAQPMRDMLANGPQPAAAPAVTLNGTRMPGGFWMLHEEEFLKFHAGLKRDGKIR